MIMLITESGGAMSFLERLDKYHQTYITQYASEKNPYAITNEKSLDSTAYYVEIKLPQSHDLCSFYIRKGKKASLIMKVGDQHIYLSDIDVVKTILGMEDADKDWFLEQFVKAYKADYTEYCFYIDDIEYSGIGLPLCPNNKILQLHTDSTIMYDDFICFINFIITKDYQSGLDLQKDMLWTNSIRKYIVLIDYYYKERQESARYLKSINYDLKAPLPYEDGPLKKAFKNVNSFDISCY